ncbi:F-box/kelch-repeat protein At3g23880-like [Silene latifolia]|uniref:F-box/kelch-repeat protein At3g23880-like n=1 Tax=Silene latifolia TaxID=37657 RepID=UPI003D76B2CA
MGDKQSNNATTKQNYLPDDLINQEILTRLPVKSISRFKLVSKQWYFTLSSSKFAKDHLIKSPFYHPSAPVNTLFIKNGNDYYLFSYDDDNDQISGNYEDNLVKLDVVFRVRDGNYLELTGCCNGLICLTPAFSEYFILWNPATRKVHKYELDGYLESFVAFMPCDVYGFGYASSVDDYKYVRILSRLFGDSPGIIAVHVFSLRSKSWRKIDSDIDNYFLYSRGQGVLINEKLYWPGCCVEGSYGDVIVSFDLGTETFAIFTYPNLELLEPLMLGAVGECLCTFGWDNSMDILKPPTIIESISLPKDLQLDIPSVMVGYTRTGKFFVTGLFSESDDGSPDSFLMPRSSILALIDLRTESTQQYTMLLKFEAGSFNIARYFPSLVSPSLIPT